jgi:hypothetical protein
VVRTVVQFHDRLEKEIRMMWPEGMIILFMKYHVQLNGIVMDGVEDVSSPKIYVERRFAVALKRAAEVWNLNMDGEMPEYTPVSGWRRRMQLDADYFYTENAEIPVDKRVNMRLGKPDEDFSACSNTAEHGEIVRLQAQLKAAVHETEELVKKNDSLMENERRLIDRLFDIGQELKAAQVCGSCINLMCVVVQGVFTMKCPYHGRTGRKERACDNYEPIGE